MGGRVSGKPIVVPQGIEVIVDGLQVRVKGKGGDLSTPFSSRIAVVKENNILKVSTKSSSREAQAVAGTTRTLLQNMVVGVAEGFVKKLELVGIGFRAQAKNTVLDLVVGYSHPIQIRAEKGITFETPSQTEILVKGADKQLVGQTAAKIRSMRPPEPYKGKGIRYSGETIRIKETKKK